MCRPPTFNLCKTLSTICLTEEEGSCGFLSFLKKKKKKLSQNDTFLLPLVIPLFSVEGQSPLRCLSENVFHVLLILRRALEVELCVHVLASLLTLGEGKKMNKNQSKF